MVILKHIISNTPVLKCLGDPNVSITTLCIDSRKVSEGAVFIAMTGVTVDGHGYINNAIRNGAKAIICEILPEEINKELVYVQVENAAKAAGEIASLFYGNPSSKIKVIGITGTNGKTTVATLLYKLFEGLGYKTGLISTVQNHIHQQIEIATHTTPDSIRIHELLSRMEQAGCTYVFMEVSSHAIHQYRISGIEFTGAVFTNISHDHLDYHQTFDEYIRVKKMFFDNLPKTAFALTNSDDKRGLVMLQNSQADKNTYSLRTPGNFKGRILENNLNGLVMNVDNLETHFRMIGTFNAYNLLAVYGTALLLGEEKMEVLAMLSSLLGAPGRFETIISPNEKVLGIVDYAHTPDALINVLATINQLRNKGQQLITVIGCGGDRDKEKRPLMAEVACEHSDKTIFTSDNPRSENPEQILNDMESGLSISHKRKSLRISDRKEAIKTACTLAHSEDIVLIAGKGHETYQEIKGVRYPFDDRKILEQTFDILNK